MATAQERCSLAGCWLVQELRTMATVHLAVLLGAEQCCRQLAWEAAQEEQNPLEVDARRGLRAQVCFAALPAVLTEPAKKGIIQTSPSLKENW